MGAASANATAIANMLYFKSNTPKPPTHRVGRLGKAGGGDRASLGHVPSSVGCSMSRIVTLTGRRRFFGRPMDLRRNIAGTFHPNARAPEMSSPPARFARRNVHEPRGDGPGMSLKRTPLHAQHVAAGARMV